MEEGDFMSLSGDRIRELRIRHDMTLDDVAKYLGINRQAVYKYEQGIVTNIPLDNLEKMADLFCTTPEYLACWTNNPDPDAPPEYATTDEARIISGGIDLSVGSMLAMCGMIGSIVMLALSGAGWSQISGGAAVEMGGWAM